MAELTPTTRTSWKDTGTMPEPVVVRVEYDHRTQTHTVTYHYEEKDPGQTIAGMYVYEALEHDSSAA